MNDGVKILLERMKTHPEEFVPPDNVKWQTLWEWYAPFLSAEDQKAYNEGYYKVMQQHFTELVLRELIDPQQKTEDWVEKVMDSHGLNSKGTTWGRLQV
jgi:hypothetical protein